MIHGVIQQTCGLLILPVSTNTFVVDLSASIIYMRKCTLESVHVKPCTSGFFLMNCVSALPEIEKHQYHIMQISVVLLYVKFNTFKMEN